MIEWVGHDTCFNRGPRAPLPLFREQTPFSDRRKRLYRCAACGDGVVVYQSLPAAAIQRLVNLVNLVSADLGDDVEPYLQQLEFNLGVARAREELLLSLFLLLLLQSSPPPATVDCGTAKRHHDDDDVAFTPARTMWTIIVRHQANEPETWTQDLNVYDTRERAIRQAERVWRDVPGIEWRLLAHATGGAGGFTARRERSETPR